MEKSLFYTMNEVSQILGLSRQTIYRMIKSGELLTHKFGKRRMIEKEYLDKWIAEHKAINK